MFIILAVIYASISLLAAPPKASLQRYHISSTSLRLIDSTVVLPVVAIWFVGLYGYTRLRTYTSHVKDNKEGKYLMELCRGIMVLAWWLPISSTLTSAMNLYASSHTWFLPVSIIISNYLSLLFPLVAFWLISHGSRRLSEVNPGRPSQISIHVTSLALIAGSVFYGYLVTNDRENLWKIYHMPLWTVLLTLAIPYVFTWYLGALAAFDIHLYTHKVKGLIYRRGWNRVAFGIVWIIGTCIALQYITAVSAKLSGMSLGWILLLVYGIIGVMALGYVFIALGAKKLTRIEEV